MKKIIIFIVSLFLIVLAITCYTYKDEIKIFNWNNNIQSEDNDDKITSNEESDPYEDFKETLNFKLENLDRYVAYKNAHDDFDYEKVVTFVNIGLDYDFYSFIKDADMSKDMLLLANKYLKLSSTYEPDDLESISDKYFISGNYYVRQMRSVAKDAFEKLSQASIDAGYPVYGQSAYREYSQQEKLYNNAVAELGKNAADNDTARPGHSEHQTGLTLDVSSTKSGNMLSFDQTGSFTWMQDNAHKYGFILRYPEGRTDITGFMYESWHYRYVGVDVATDMHDNYPYLTYEEYYYKFIDNKN